MPARAGKKRRDAGATRPVHKPDRISKRIPDDPIRRAMDCYGWEAEVTAEDWEELRVPTWHKWLRLVSVEPDQEWRWWRGKVGRDPRSWRPEIHHLCLPPQRDRHRAWPPAAATKFDGIEARAIRIHWGFPVEEAEAGLAEIADFREREPEIAESIKKPLAELERRLRVIRDEG